MQPRIALVYHLNLNHYSLSARVRKEFLKFYLTEMLQGIQVPINLSLTSEDLTTIKNSDRAVFEKLVNHPKIKFLKSTYSHCLVSEFPKDLQLQMDCGESLQKELIPEGKILPVGTFAELDFPRGKTSLVAKFWPYCLVNQTIISHKSTVPCQVLYKIKGKPGPLLLCVHKEMGYRNSYHLFLREGCSAEEVVNALCRDWDFIHQENPDKFLVAHIDFEAPLLNKVCFGVKSKEVSPPRIDLFQKLHTSFGKADLKFIHLETKFLQPLEKTGISVIPKELDKKDKQSPKAHLIKRKILRNRKKFIETDPLLYLSLQNSDYFVLDQKSLAFDAKYHGRPGKVVIAKSGYRTPEFEQKLQYLTRLSVNKKQRLFSTARKITNLFALNKSVVAALINGSVAWGEPLYVCDTSDLDLDIVLTQDELTMPRHISKKIKKVEIFVNNANKLFTARKADYASLKFSLSGVKIGLHVIPFRTFKKICCYNFKDAKGTICLAEYRLELKEKEPIYIQRNFAGEQYGFVCKIEKIKIGQLTHTPLVIISRGCYFNGLLPDKYLTYPVVISKSPKIHYLTNELKRNLCKRLKYEKQEGLISKSAHLGNLPHAKDRIPACEIEHLKLETDLFENLLIP